MSEVKLFGKMIQLMPNDDVSGAPRGAHLVGVVDSEPNSDHNLSSSNASVSMESHENKKQSNAAMDSTEEEEEERKPDKILQCPRCDSNDTKFCYFNNYNLNQPRHFCKTCQRYWTAGGAVRNVPVGSGRRKTKHNPDTEQLPGNVFPAPPWYPAPIWSSPLGKHSREGDLIKSKMLRIDYPSEVAKSSIWSTLGIKNEKVDLIGSVGVFGGFQSKVREMNSVGDGSLALYANPAAFSRSLRFHENAE